MTRIIGRVVGPDGRPAHGWVRLRPQQPAATATLPDERVVVAGDRTVTLDADGRLDVEVLVPPGSTWEVQASLAGAVSISRVGVVLPSVGTVTLEWVLGLVESPDPPGGSGQAIVVSPDGMTYVLPAVAVADEIFTTDLAVLSEDGLTYTIETTGGAP